MEALYADWVRFKQYCDSLSEPPVKGFVQRLYNPQSRMRRASKLEQGVMDDISKLEEYFRASEEQKKGEQQGKPSWDLVDDHFSGSSMLPSSSGSCSSFYKSSSKGSVTSAAPPAGCRRMVEDAGESTSSRVSRTGDPTDPQAVDALEQEVMSFKQDEQQKGDDDDSTKCDSVASILSAIISEVELHQVLLDKLDESFTTGLSEMPGPQLVSSPASSSLERKQELASSISTVVDEKQELQSEENDDNDLLGQVLELKTEVLQLKHQLNVQEMKSLACRHGLVALVQGIILCSTLIPLVTKLRGDEFASFT